MTQKAILVPVLAVVLAASLVADENLKPPAGSMSTQAADFAPGGTIRVDGSYDDLYVEGWDRARVELTTTKFMPYEYDPEHPQHGAQNLETVGVDLERKSPTEMTISTSLPAKKGLLTKLGMSSKTNHVRIAYHLHVPRDSKLVIHHNVGLVSVSDVTGDIEATCHRGDIVLWLPESAKYTIDARNKLGKVSSDFTGGSVTRFLVGQEFKGSDASAPHRLFLRMGFGGITLKPILPESQAPAASPAEGTK
jgi:hypothetical protein